MNQAVRRYDFVDLITKKKKEKKLGKKDKMKLFFSLS